MTHRTTMAGWLVACAVALAGTAVFAQPRPGMQPPTDAQAARGELLYATHCIACHTTQVHWRAKKVVTDWTRLKAEVRRWAANGGLGWTNEEVVDVARYLNATIYRFPAAAGTELGARGNNPRS